MRYTPIGYTIIWAIIIKLIQYLINVKTWSVLLLGGYLGSLTKSIHKFLPHFRNSFFLFFFFFSLHQQNTKILVLSVEPFFGFLTIRWKSFGVWSMECPALISCSLKYTTIKIPIVRRLNISRLVYYSLPHNVFI